MTTRRPSKTNTAIRAGIRSRWFGPAMEGVRARDLASWSRIHKDPADRPTEYEDAMRPALVAEYAQATGHDTTAGRVCVAARRWGEAGLDCGDGLVARFRVDHGEWRIVVTGPL